MTDKIKLTWWQYQKQDRVWLFLFAGAFFALALVLYFHFFVEEFYWIGIFRDTGLNGIWIAITITVGIMASIGYKIIYKGWKEYLNDPKA